MFTRHLLAWAWTFAFACSLGAAEPFDAAAFIQTLREPPAVEIATRALDKVPDPAKVHTMDFSRDMKTFCAVYTNGMVVRWDVETGKLKGINRVLASKVRPRIAAGADMFIVTFALSQDHKRLALMLRSDDVVFWDIEKEEVISVLAADLKAPSATLAFSSTGKYALLGLLPQKGVLVIDADTGEKVFVHDAAKSQITNLAISPDDGWAMFAEKDGAVHMFPLLGGLGNSHPFRAIRPIVHFKGTNLGAFFISHTNELNQTVFDAHQSFGMRAGLPARLAISANSRYLAIFDNEGMVEIRPVHAPGLAWYQPMEDDKPLMIAMGSDGRTICLYTKEGLKLKHLSAPPLPPAARASLAMHELLDTENFAGLKAVAKQLNQQQEQTFAWAPLDSPVDIFMSTLATHPDAQTLMQKWLAEDKDALVPQLVLASAYISEAWAHRGGGVAATVTEEGWRGFRENIKRARDIMEPLCEKPNAPGSARTRLLTIAMAESWPARRWMPHADWMVANAPKYVSGHAQVMQRLLPRWGGAPGESAAYAARVADAIGGAEGDAVYAQCWLSLYDLHGQRGDIVHELAMDLPRVKQGLLHLADTSPHSAYFGHRGLQVGLRQRDRDMAQAFNARLKPPTANWELGWWRSPQEFNTALRYAAGM